MIRGFGAGEQKITETCLFRHIKKAEQNQVPTTQDTKTEEKYYFSPLMVAFELKINSKHNKSQAQGYCRVS